MTKITKITRLKHPGVFRDFTWPGDLPTFGRFNLVYGWNGTGKTTLSEVFRALERREMASGIEAVINFNDNEISQENFEQGPVEVRVFNRSFVQENVFPSGGSHVPPILIVGKENVEKQKTLDSLKSQLEKARADVVTTVEKAKRASVSLEQHCESIPVPFVQATLSEAQPDQGVEARNR